jgi:hypothetical protein
MENTANDAKTGKRMKAAFLPSDGKLPFPARQPF